MEDFKEIIDVKPSPKNASAKSGDWPIYEIVLKGQSEILEVAVPTNVSYGDKQYVPELGDHIKPFKNKIGTLQITGKGFKKGRGRVEKEPEQAKENTTPVKEKESNEVLHPRPGTSAPALQSENEGVMDWFYRLTPFYTATISVRSEPKEIDALVESCYRKAVEIANGELTNNESEEIPY